MKVLLFTSAEEDYLQDSIIHGFKKLLGKDAVDYPVKNIIYNDYKERKKIRGNGFTLYGLLAAELKSDCDINVEKVIAEKQFELIIFTSIYRQYEIFYKYYSLFVKTKTTIWIMDGEDSPILFPYLGKHLKKFFAAIKPHKHFIYFKRELLPETLNSVYLRLPVSELGFTALPERVKPISFSIPKEKIINTITEKTKLFTANIVDDEVAHKIYGTGKQIFFNKEEDYYKDIQTSKFGITTKRAGWDCLRHYEIAANGAVICFKNLNKKLASCAPHGLVDGENCIAYLDYSDLMNKIKKLSETDYKKLQQCGFKWVDDNATTSRVKNLLTTYYQLN